MKSTAVLLPIAFVVGGIVGAWGPVEELRALKARPTAENRSGKKPQSFDAFAKMMNIPDVAKKRRPAAVAHGPEKRAGKTNAVAAVKSVRKETAGAGKKPPQTINPEDLRARIEEAAELWRTRSELVRANAVKKLALDAAGEERFDAAVERMNAELRSSIQMIADALANEEEMTAELGVRLMGDLSTTLAETYDRIGDGLDEEGRNKVSHLQLVELVDPSVAEPLIDVQHKLEALPIRRPR